ncbi:MAG TPA: hypothetical protein VMF04_06330 [Thermoplasmata archaeon]|nr:hypothetical protein [Thermoplasmata archaeon]
MTARDRTEGIPSVPDDFDAAVDWFERLSSDLVRLAEYPLPDVEHAVRTFERRVERHVREFARRLDATEPPRGRASEARALLRADHAWFATSNEQLDWFFRIVAQEDHGGHRQALGQYGRVFAESLRRHRADERAYLEGRRAAVPSGRL